MGIFGSKALDYSAGNGFLPKMKPSMYYPHHLPGQATSTEMNFGLLSEEAKNGKHQRLVDRVVNFSTTLEYSQGNFDYSTARQTKSTSPAEQESSGTSGGEDMAYLANIVEQQINNQENIYFELLPYLEEFEDKLRTQLSIEQRKFFMSLFRIGMGFSLIENLSTLSIQGFCHPSVSNALNGPRQLIETMEKNKLKWDLEFWGDNLAQMTIAKTAIYVGYFQSKYTAESPSSVMEFIPAKSP